MTVKTPIRTVFDSSNNATGLAEFQSGEAIGPNHGGTGLTSLGTTGQYLKVNSAATAMEWATLDFASETYVDSAVSNLVDTAPDALNTLNELASALNDDSNFATTINSSIATKLTISDFGTYFDNNLATKNTASLSEGSNLYYTDARVANYLSNNSYVTQSYVQSQIETKDNSDEITEGSTNLYYTDARVRAAISSSGDLSYDSSTGSFSVTTYKSSNFSTDFAAKNTSDLSEGSTNLYFTETRSRNSISVTGDLSYNSSTGVISLTTYKSSDFDTDLASKSTSDLSEGNNLYYTLDRVNSAFDSRLADKSTDNLSEGSSNLYYTQSRVNSAFDTSLASKNTSDLAEGNNLYYTQSRVNSAFDTRLASKNTSDISEGNNLYYTQSRVNSAFDSRLANKSTDNVSEGSSNLYYTDTRVGSYLTTNSYATESYVDTAVNNLIGGAPAALDTLNELAEALNDDENFYASIAPTARSSISASGDLSYNSSTGVMNFSLPANTATTDDAIALSIALG